MDESYPSDCIAYRYLIKSSNKRHLVKGYTPPKEIISTHLNTGHLPEDVVPVPSQTSDKSLQLKPAGKAVQARQPFTPSRTDEDTPSVPSGSIQAVGDTSIAVTDDSAAELDALILEAKTSEHLVRDPDPVISLVTNALPSLQSGTKKMNISNYRKHPSKISSLSAGRLPGKKGFNACKNTRATT